MSKSLSLLLLLKPLYETTEEMIEIKKLKSTKLNELYTAFNQAYIEFSTPLVTKESLNTMLERKGYSAQHSFGAFENGKLVSFILNGIGDHLGKSTAYNASTGTLTEYRGQNLAGRIFDETFPFLKKKGIKQYLLEVRQDNVAAFNLFLKQGFEISRELNYYIIEASDIKPIVKPALDNFHLRELDILELEVISSFWDFNPSWQNSPDAVNRRCDDFQALGIYDDRNHLLAYGLINTSSGDIIQLAVDKRYRRQGLGTILFKELIKLNQYHLIRIINTEKGYLPMEKFIEEHLNIPLRGCQYEMIKSLV